MHPEQSPRQPRLVTGVTMRDYQLVGTEWLTSLYINGFNGILADEMGLGKTLQAIAFLAHIYDMGTRGPFLIVAPLSTVCNWVMEIERFTPSIPVILYHGSKEYRANLRRTVMSEGKKFPIVVTTYEICINDKKHLEKHQWKYIILDEAHRIKNPNCKLVKELSTYKVTNRLLLTGTPLQNDLEELWSLLNFIMPQEFNSAMAFLEEFKRIGELGQPAYVSQLHNILKPFLLRRTKDSGKELVSLAIHGYVGIDAIRAVDLEDLEIPKKREYLLYAPLVPKQRLLYQAALEGRLREELVSMMMGDVEEGKPGGVELEPIESTRRRSKRNSSEKNYEELADTHFFEQASVQPAARPAQHSRETVNRRKLVEKHVNTLGLNNTIIQLRKICNHPYLFNLSGDDDDLDNDDSHTSSSSSTAISKSLLKITKTLPDIVAWSGKMLILERLLPKLFERGHKVLIFSQWKRVLDVIEDWCRVVKGWRSFRLDGSVDVQERVRQMKEFNNKSDVKLFLLTTRAGGLGINLTGADTNPQADLQAQDRAHRIGQKKPVIVYRLLTADTNSTVETEMLAKAAAKRKLEKLVIHKKEFKGEKAYYAQKSKDLTEEEMTTILTTEEAERIQSRQKDPANAVYTPETVLNDVDLERIMDRSDEAYERASAGKEGQNGHFEVLEEEEGVVLV
ncbi:hypothetical protein HK097_010690 [Rhizophlyctis rosea]|uniref:Uncharacterized protein n=1 Tax=Rhizophlyctis rosea TaxID=64517 RepID=A0AAD5X0C2_9FUNG|nr:hypothetical protein HK097_010690 [Rhizophlyctis rosea]